jgi:hypothetical protein
MTGVRLDLYMDHHLIVYGLVDASVMQIAIQKKVFALMKEYNISSRLTFSNSLIEEKHLSDIKCNELCRLLNLDTNNGIIIHSDILMKYLKSKYPNLYFVSSTTKVLTDFNDFKHELENPDFTYVVPDFRLNKQLEKLNSLSESYKPKVEFLCNECCWYGCKDRKECYKSVSKQNLGIDCMDHVCKAPFYKEGYRFSRVMENPAFISLEDILNIYVPMGYSNFKIEGRDLIRLGFQNSQTSCPYPYILLRQSSSILHQIQTLIHLPYHLTKLIVNLILHNDLQYLLMHFLHELLVELFFDLAKNLVLKFVYHNLRFVYFY